MIRINKDLLKQEGLAGLTTFFTLAYIIIVAPSFYVQAGASFPAAFAATCIVTIVGTVLLALFSNLPIVVAPGLSLIPYFCFEVILQQGFNWYQGLAFVFIVGVLFTFITLTRLREMIIAAIPKSLGLGIAGGIGLFIGFIALKNAGVIISDHATLVSLGKLTHLPALMFFVGFLLIAVLEGCNVPGAILLGIMMMSVMAGVFGLTHLNGVFAWPDLSLHDFGHLDFHGVLAFHNISTLFSILMIALFDSTGTLLGLTKLMHFQDEKLMYKKINRALLGESFGTIFSSLIGATTLSPFVENAAGIRAGGRTGLTALVAASCFIIMLFMAPLAEAIPPFAVASGLFYVACLMIKPFAQIDFEDTTELIPAVMMLLMIPLTFSIVDGVGIGVICYVALKGARQDWKAIKPMLWLLTLIFMVYFSL